MSVFLFNNICIILIYSGVAGLFQRGGAQGELLLGVFYFIFQSYGTLGSFSWGSLWEPVGACGRGRVPRPPWLRRCVCIYYVFFVFYL